MTIEKYATPLEKATLEAVARFGGDVAAAASFLEVTPVAIESRLRRLRKRAARQGWAPDHGLTRPVPEGFHVRGFSAYYEKTDDQPAVWVKADQDAKHRAEALREAVEEIMATSKGGIAPIPAPDRVDESDLMTAYLIGDHHNGMYSWAEETGANWDAEIASDTLVKSFYRLGDATPSTAHGLIVSIGDFYHADNSAGVTPTAGHALDTDSRHARVVRMGAHVLQQVIQYALQKHSTVEVLIIAGNHDPESSVWLALCLEMAFESEPRCNVRTSPRAYQYTLWGDCLIGTTHGHKCKPAALMEVMAADARADWGHAKFCHWYTGHIHHRSVMELRGGIVESLSVLPPGDAWHVGQGYRSQRGMKAAVWHKRLGCVTEINATIEYLTDE